MPEYKQVNYKLPPSLVEALSSKAKEENRTATSLVIQALEQLLEISLTSQLQHIDQKLYESIQELQKRVEQLEERNIDKILYERISKVEECLEQAEARNIEGNLFGRICNLEERLESFGSSTNKETDQNTSKSIEKNSKELEGQLKLLNDETTKDKVEESDLQSIELNREIGHAEIIALTNMHIAAVRARHARKQNIIHNGITYTPSGRKRHPSWKPEIDESQSLE